jgi:hypothetical protein
MMATVTPINPDKDRPPPADTEAERAILAIVLITESTAKTRTLVQPVHFYDDSNRLTYEAAIALNLAQTPADVLTVRGYLADRGQLQRVGGPSYLAELLSVPTASNPEAYAERIRDKYALRQIIASASRAKAEAYLATNAASLLAGYLASLNEIQPSSRQPIATLTTLEVFEDQPDVPWVVRGIYLAPGRPSLVAGYGYSAKSVSCQAMLLAIAAGRAVWGEFDVPRPMVVLHLDHEQGKRATVLRYQRLARAMRITPADLGDRLRVAALPARFRLSNDDAEAVLEAACQGVAVCLIDSLRATTPNVDENDSMIREHLDKLLRVSEKTGTAFVVIHHAGKNGKDKDAREKSRGSSAIFDACGLVLQLDGKLTDDGVTLVDVKMVKAPADASGSAVKPFVIKVSDVMSDDGDERWGLGCVYQDETMPGEDIQAVRFVALKINVMNAVRTNPMISGADAIRARVGARAVDVRQAVRELIDEGKIENVGTANRPRLRVVYNPSGGLGE